MVALQAHVHRVLAVWFLILGTSQLTPSLKEPVKHFTYETRLLRLVMHLQGKLMSPSARPEDMMQSMRMAAFTAMC